MRCIVELFLSRRGFLFCVRFTGFSVEHFEIRTPCFTAWWTIFEQHIHVYLVLNMCSTDMEVSEEKDVRQLNEPTYIFSHHMLAEFGSKICQILGIVMLHLQQSYMIEEKVRRTNNPRSKG